MSSGRVPALAFTTSLFDTSYFFEQIGYMFIKFRPIIAFECAGPFALDATGQICVDNFNDTRYPSCINSWRLGFGTGE